MISVVIPVYNAGRYLMRAVDSAIMQEDVEKEIIIIDDCSTDDGISGLVNFMKNEYGLQVNPLSGISLQSGMDSVLAGMITGAKMTDNNEVASGTKIYIYRNRENKGASYTRNAGVFLAKGEYVAFLDGDDWWDNNKLKIQLAAIEKDGTPLCCTARALFNEKEIGWDRIISVPRKITLKHLEKTNYISCSSVLIKREVALDYPMKHDDAHEDYYAWLKLLKDYKYVTGVDQPLLKYRMNKNSKSANKLKSAAMTYRTYLYAGYEKKQAMKMMVSYAYYGLKKYL